MADEEFRAHLIEVGRDAMGRNDGWRWWHPRHLARLLDFWEPLIREDERRRVAEEVATEVQALLDAEKDSANMDRDWALLQCRAIARRVGGAS